SLTAMCYGYLLGSGGSGGSSVWSLDGDDAYYDDGNVGIGTDSPASTLDIGSAGKLSFGHAAYGLTGNFVWPGITGGVGVGLYANKNYAGAAVGFGFDNNGTFEPVMTAIPNGNVGIGTTSPTQRLTIRNGSLAFNASSP